MLSSEGVITQFSASGLVGHGDVRLHRTDLSQKVCDHLQGSFAIIYISNQHGLSGRTPTDNRYVDELLTNLEIIAEFIVMIAGLSFLDGLRRVSYCALSCLKSRNCSGKIATMGTQVDRAMEKKVLSG
jgi:hypothetical protein